MFRIIAFGARVRVSKLLYLLRMSRNGDQIYYAVGRGRETGIYNSWLECKAQIEGISNAKYRKFFSLEEAEEFVKFWRNYSSPSKKSQNENCVSKFSRREANSKKRSKDGFDKFESKKLGLGVEEAVETRNAVGLRPYVSPIPFSLHCQFRNDVRNKDRLNNFTNFEKRMTPERKNTTSVPSRKNSLGTNTLTKADLEFLELEISNNSRFFTSTPINVIEPVEAPSQNIANDNQSADKSSEPVIKTEVVQEDEEVSQAGSKVPDCLKILELVLKEIVGDSNDEFKEIRNNLRRILEKNHPTNCPVNPQMESQGSDLGESRNEEVEVRTQEPTPGQQQTAPLSPCPNPPTSPAPRSPVPRSLDHQNAEVLALNLRLDSFEKRFDSCLKEIGAIGSELTQIRTEIKEIKDSLAQASSGCSPRKRNDGLLQTTLTFASPNKSGSSQPNYSSREYSTDRGEPSKQRESDECRTNRGKRRRLSRSDSSEKSKRPTEEVDDDILRNIKTEEVAYTTFSFDENDFVEVYTDGACHYNGEREAKAGIGIWFGDCHPLNVSEPVMGSPTNNVAEIQAARIAIELAAKAGVKKLKIFTDSEFLINCVTKWMHRWKRNGWTLVRGGAVKNRKELEKLDKAASKITVRWEKVLAHSGIKGNEMADRLANQGAEKYGT